MQVRKETSSSSTETPATGRRVALVIEDQRSVSRLLAELLAKVGFDTYEVASAEAADAFLQAREADLILLDLKLPGRSGDDWLISFRQRNGNTPVMAVSGVEDPMRKAAVLRDGADVFITKPFDVVELEAHIYALLRRPRSLCERSICDGSAYLNPTRSDVRVGDVQIVLRQREFQLLWYLAQHEGRWVSVASLSEAVLGAASDLNIEATRVHVCNMKQKLLCLSHLLVIEARRNLGYRIVNMSVGTSTIR